MKILFVASGNGKFGLSPFIVSQAASLENNGVEIDYYLIDKRGIKGYLGHIKKLKKKIKSNNYHVIHTHYSYGGWISLLTNTSPPKIVSFMGSDVQGSANLNRVTSILNYTLSKLIQPFISHMIAKSKNIQSYIYLKRKSTIIPNGVNFEKFRVIPKEEAREKIKIKSTKKQILFLGDKKDRRKNFQLLDKALKLLQNEDVELADFSYPISPEIIPYYINAADVVVLTSFAEGSPNVIKEAMACCCPIVSVDVGDVVEVISNTEGCYISKYDSKDLAENIMKAVNYKEGKTTGLEDIAHLEINRIANRIIDVYNNLNR